MRRTREEKAITLIALIITIVVLLILAVVAINAVTGDGIIQHATNAKTSYQNAQAKENSIIGEYVNFLNEHTSSKKIINFSCTITYYTPNGNTIESRKENHKLQAEEGMTWYEWCNSSYNNINLRCDDLNYLVYNNVDYGTEMIMNDNATTALGKDFIIDGKEYSSVPLEE